MPKCIRLISTVLTAFILLLTGIGFDMSAGPAFAAGEQLHTVHVPVFDQQAKDEQQLNPAAPGQPQDQYPLMRPSPETRKKWIENYNKAPRAAPADTLNRRLMQSAPTLSLNLMDYSPWNSTNMAERDQLHCGNCWVWAGTGVMEIALRVQKGVTDRLSIQYLNSNFNGGLFTNDGNDSNDWASCGGWLNDLTSFYQSRGKALPWTNFNASFQDGGRYCGMGTSVIAPNISTSPYYGITSITPVTISTQGESQATAITNIKNMLDQNRAVIFSFLLPKSEDWYGTNGFVPYWNNQPDYFIWGIPDTSGRTADSGEAGHSVLCIGYDDSTVPASWIMLNSWGTRPDRLNGQFRIPMNINYECTYIDPSRKVVPSFYWQTLDITFADNPPQQSDQEIIGADITDASNANNAGNYFVLTQFTATGTGNMAEFRIKCTGAGNVKVAIYSDNAGQPGTLLNSAGASTPVVTGWNNIAFPSTALTAGTNYWLAFNSDSPVVGARAAASNRRFKPMPFATAFPASAGTGFTSDSIYYGLTAGWGISTSISLVGASASDTSNANNAGNYFVLTQFTATGTGNMAEFRIKCTGAGNVKVAIYSDNAGQPGTLLNSVGASTPVVTGWNNIAFPSTALTAGTNYWLAFNSDSPVVGARAAASNRRFKPMPFATAFPASAGTGFTSDSIYYGLTAGWGISTSISLVGASVSDTSNTNNAGNYFVLTQFTATSTGNMSEFRIKCTGAGNVKVAIYSDNAGQPGTLLNSVGDSTPVFAGWNNIAFPSTALTAGTNYWLAFNSDSPVVGARAAASNRRFKPMPFATAFPASAGTGFTSDSIYYGLTAGWGTTAP